MCSAGSTALDFGEVALLRSWDLGFRSSGPEGRRESVAWAGAAGQAGQGGRQAGAWHRPGTEERFQTEIQGEGVCGLMALMIGVVSVTPLAGANALSRSCRTGPYKKGAFPWVVGAPGHSKC